MMDQNNLEKDAIICSSLSNYFPQSFARLPEQYKGNQQLACTGNPDQQGPDYASRSP